MVLICRLLCSVQPSLRSSAFVECCFTHAERFLFAAITETINIFCRVRHSNPKATSYIINLESLRPSGLGVGGGVGRGEVGVVHQQWRKCQRLCSKVWSLRQKFKWWRSFVALLGKTGSKMICIPTPKMGRIRWSIGMLQTQ